MINTPQRCISTFAVIARLAQEHLRAFGALEPKMGIVIPGEADSAAELNSSIAVCR